MAAVACEELVKGLAQSLQDDSHWCCNEDFLSLCKLAHEDLNTSVKTWWGSRDLWLDMLATETARKLGVQLDLNRLLGASWVEQVDAWTDAAYARATAGLSCAPQRAMLHAKTAPLVQKVMRNMSGEVCHTRIFARHARNVRNMRGILPKRAAAIDCELCGKAFSERLGKCPGCFPRAAAPRKDSDEGARPEDPRTDWRKHASLPIESVPWDEASEVLWCHGGSGGIFLAKLPGGVVCVKHCAPQELFAQRLADALGVRAARLRVLGGPGAERDEAACLRRSIRKIAPDVGQNDWLPTRKILQHEFLAVLEFVDGFGMMGLDAHNHLKDADAAVWSELGRLMAFDMLINNYDRLPLAWTNEGNLGNIMLGSKLGPVVGIDQCVAPITHPEGCERYTNRVGEAVREARDGAGRHFGHVQEAIYNNTGVKLSDEQLESLRLGCLQLAQEIASRDLEKVLAGISQEVIETYDGRQDCAAASRAASDMVRAASAALGRALSPS